MVVVVVVVKVVPLGQMAPVCPLLSAAAAKFVCASTIIGRKCAKDCANAYLKLNQT